MLQGNVHSTRRHPPIMPRQMDGRIHQRLDIACEHSVTSTTNLHSGQKDWCMQGTVRCIQMLGSTISISVGSRRIAAYAHGCYSAGAITHSMTYLVPQPKYGTRSDGTGSVNVDYAQRRSR